MAKNDLKRLSYATSFKNTKKVLYVLLLKGDIWGIHRKQKKKIKISFFCKGQTPAPYPSDHDSKQALRLFMKSWDMICE